MGLLLPFGDAMFQMFGVFAEFKRSIIREQINAELERAKTNGKKLGRPRVDESVEQALREALRRGDKGIRKIARDLGVSVVQGMAPPAWFKGGKIYLRIFPPKKCHGQPHGQPA